MPGISANPRLSGSWLAAAAGLLEDVPHDRSMHGFNSSPHGARDGVLVLHERGEEEGVLLTFEEQFRWHPDGGVGAEECELGRAATQLPAEHKTVRSS